MKEDRDWRTLCFSMLFYSKTLSYTPLLLPPLGRCVRLFHYQTFILTSLHPSPWESSAHLLAGEPNSSNAVSLACFFHVLMLSSILQVGEPNPNHTTSRGDTGVRHCYWCWGQDDERERRDPCPPGAYTRVSLNSAFLQLSRCTETPTPANPFPPLRDFLVTKFTALSAL